MPLSVQRTAGKLVVLLLALAVACERPAPTGTPQAPAGTAPGVLPALPVTRGPSWDQLDNAERDGWDSEVFAAEATGQLKTLGRLFTDPAPPADVELGRIAAEEIAVHPLLGESLARAFDDPQFRVDRARPTAGEPRRGLAALRQSLLELKESFRDAKGLRFEPKVVGLERLEAGVTTRQLITIAGQTPGGFLEHNAVWSIRWQSTPPPARMASLEVLELEQVLRPGAGPLLSDCTESALGGNPSYRSQLLRGLNHWLERIQENRFFALLGTPGLAAGDVNGDGLEDLYVCQEGGLPNRLFLHRPDGTADDASELSGADWIDSTRSALLIDLDNDRRLDLAAAVLGAAVFAQGGGDGRFAVRESLPTSLDTMSLAAADHDLDGDLDVYLCSYNRDDISRDAGVSVGASEGLVYHDSQNGARNYLFRNDIAGPGGGLDRAWRFTDATVETGLDENNRRFSFAAAWEDYDGDGDPDLYVANDFGRNNLYRNELKPGLPPRFTDVAAQAGAEDSASGMGVAWGDYDQDGWMDIYVSNMFSAAGSRITHQSRFKADATEEVRARLRRFARGNTLLRNRGDGTFDDVSEAARVTMGRWAWSSNFIDWNNDGWEDLLVSNGYVTTEDTGDL